MQFFVVFILSAMFLASKDVQGLEDLIGTSMQQCLNCLCHARSGCWSRFNCARYSVSIDYWKKGGSHAVGEHTSDDQAYKACMSNENCILNTIKSYTDSFGQHDCNCDGTFDCKDRLAIHLFGEQCYNPKYGSIYARRFNDCAKQIGVSDMAANEGVCVIPEVEVF